MDESLLFAARRCDSETFEIFLEEDALVYYKDKNHMTPLHWAAEHGHTDIVAQLVSTNADINCKAMGGQTPLHLTALTGHTETAAILISNGAYINTKDGFGQTPLHLAAGAGYIDTATLLVSKGACISSKDGFTPLHLAAKRGHTEIAAILVSLGADVNCKDHFGLTPLHGAAEGGQTNTAAFLVSNGADVNIRSRNGETPIFLAERWNHKDTTAILMSKKHDIYIRCSNLCIPQWKVENAMNWAKGKAKILLQLISMGLNIDQSTKAAKHCNSLEEAQEYVQTLSNVVTCVPSNIPGDGGLQQNDQDCTLPWIEDVTTFKTLLTFGTYKAYGNRIYLAGACNVGKSTLACLLIGDDIPKCWKSTDGLRIFFGRNGIDVKNIKMVSLAKSKDNHDVLSNVLLGRPDMTQDKLNNDVTLIYSRRKDGSVEQQSVPAIANSESSKPVELSTESVTAYTSFDKNLHITDEKAKLKSLLKCSSIHKDIKEELIKGTYSVNIAPSDLVDFGGQRSYDMTHQLFIQGKGTFTLIFDGRKKLHDPLKEYQQGDVTTESILKHWVDSILTYCGVDDDDILPVILFVATHKDEMKEDEHSIKIKEFKDDLTKMFQNHERQQRIEYHDIFFINATDANDPEVERLKAKYVDIAFKQKSWGTRMPMAWVPLELQMSEMRENNISLISRKELEEVNQANGDLALTEKQLDQFLKVQHSLGKIMYFEGQALEKYVIIQPRTLVDILRSFITAEMFWPLDRTLNGVLKEMRKSGKIKRRDLFKLWSQEEFQHHMPNDDYKEFIAKVLVHLDLLVEPNTQKNTSDFYLVPCVVKQVPPKIDFDKLYGNIKTLCLSYNLLKSPIPSALSFKLIGASMNIWPLKETENGACLYYKAATFCIDTSNTLHVLVQSDRVLVCLMNERSKHFISPDIATCVQECLTLALTTSLEFYHNSFGNVVSKLTISDLFKIQVMDKCETGNCYISLTDTKMKPPWKCSLGKEHKTKSHLYWTYKGQKDCSSECEGLDEQCLKLCPEEKHLARLARCLEMNDLYKFFIMLGLSKKDWTDFEYKHRGQGVNPLMIKIDILCHWKGSAIKPSFNDLLKALKEISYDHHSLCQIFREDRRILDIKGGLLLGVPDNYILSDLSRQIGNCAIHLGVELGIDFCDIQETMYNHRKMSQQNYDIFKKWKEAPHGHNNTFRYLMHVLNIVSPVGLKFLNEKYNIS